MQRIIAPICQCHDIIHYKTLKMKNNLLIQNFGTTTESTSLEDIHQLLEHIQRNIQKEVASKQTIIEKQEERIGQLTIEVSERNEAIKELYEKLESCRKSSEGSRQLVNKLLNDIDRLQQDVEWYKRTYETRSLLGTIKEKIFRKLL